MNTLRIMPIVVLALSVLGMSTQSTLDRSVRPDQPRVYLELGEQLAELAQSEQDRELARAVLGMGVVINRQRNDASTAASCCVALAWAFSDNPIMQGRLWDLALLIDPARYTQWAQYRPLTSTTNAMEDAAECLRLARNADVDGATNLYRRPEVRAIIEQTAQDLGYTRDELNQTLNPMLGGISRDPCRGNFFYTDVENGESIRRICTAHSAPLGTTQSTQTLVMLLRIEAACLDANQSINDWGSASMLGSTTPMRPASVEWLIKELRIDPERPYLRDGVWSSTP